MNLKIKLISILFILLIFPKLLNAATLTAASCDRDDVWAKVNLASDGDTVEIPAGNCTDSGRGKWLTGITFWKSIHIKGAGSDQTIIQDGIPRTGWGDSVFWFYGGSTNEDIRISGIKFTGGASGSTGTIEILGSTYDINFQLDDLDFTNINRRAILIAGDDSYGVIYNSNFQNITSSAIWVGAANPESVYAGSTQHMGTINNVFIEDNTFADCSDGALDVDASGAAVFRYNTSEDAMVGTHGFDSVLRPGMNMEVYQNTFNCTHYCSQGIGAIQYRGGSGVVFNNTIETGANGYQSPYIALTNYRSHTTGSDCANAYDWCDGSGVEDENTTGQNGWRCFGQPGTSNPSYYSPSVSITAQPIYIWNNNGGVIGATIYDNCSGTSYVSQHIQENRDYYNTQKSGWPAAAYQYPHSLRGNVYYLCQSGSGCCGKSSNLLSPTSHNAGSFSAGDTIYLCGTITTSLNTPSSGTSGNEIVYRGDYPVYSGILSGTPNLTVKRSNLKFYNFTGQNSTTNGVWISPTDENISNLYFYGIIIHDSNNVGIYVRSEPADAIAGYTISNLEFDTVNIYQNGANGLIAGSGFGDVSNINVHDSIFYGNGTDNDNYYQGLTFAGGYRRSVYDFYWTQLDSSNIWYNVYSVEPYIIEQRGADATHDLIWTKYTGSCPGGLSAHGQWCYSSGTNYIYYDAVGEEPNSGWSGSTADGAWVLFYGTIHDIYIDDNEAYGNIGDCGIYIDNATYDVLSINGNKIHDQIIRSGSPASGGHGLCLRRTINATITNNLIYDNPKLALYIYDHSDELYIYNNTLNGMSEVSNGIYFNNYNGGTTVSIKNNIISNFGVYGITDTKNGYTIQEDYNQFYNNTNNCNNISGCPNSNSQTGNPFYLPGNNFHLSSNSPCLEQGDNSLSVGSYDLDGNTRKIGIIDMGCYEYFYSPSSPVITGITIQ